MIIREKAFCPKCYETKPWHLESSYETVTVHEVTFSYLETKAICNTCGSQVYVPAVNDKNWYERHKAYYNLLESLNTEVLPHGCSQ